MGIAEGVRSVVTAPQVGLLQEVNVRPYQWVKAGQPVALLRPLDPRAELGLMQSELDIARLRLEPSAADDNALDFERLRVEDFRLKQELSEATLNLRLAEKTLRRNDELRKEKLISEQLYDVSVHDRDRFLAEVKEKTAATMQIEARMAKLKVMGEPEHPGSNPAVHVFLAQAESRLAETRSNFTAVPLLAPISGMIQGVFRQAGEFVADSEPILSIASDKSDRVVAYLRQPYLVEPKVGMQVEVLTRARTRQRLPAQISEIGAQLEVITNSLAFLRPGHLVDVGLPLAITLPPDAEIRPGETVNVLFIKPVRTRRTAPEPEDAQASRE